MFNALLKKYDKYLGYKRNLDGSLVIYRKSPYTTMKFDVIQIENQYLGSYKWILRKLVLMDSRRRDFFVKSIQNNKKLKQKQKDNRQSKEIAEFVLNGGFTVIN